MAKRRKRRTGPKPPDDQSGIGPLDELAQQGEPVQQPAHDPNHFAEIEQNTEEPVSFDLEIERTPVPPPPEPETPEPPSWLMRNWYVALNAVYRYFYFVGIMLLRTTRTRRRRIVHLLKHWLKSAAERRSKKTKHLRDYFRNGWRDLTTPIREIRDWYRDFRSDVRAAKTLGGGERLRRVYWHTVAFLLVRFRRVVCILLNYLAPICALVLLIITVNYWNGITVGLELTYNGEKIGYISDQSVFDQAEADMKSRMILGEVMIEDPTQEDVTELTDEEKTSAEESARREASIRPQFELTVVDPVELIDADDLTDMLIYAVGKNANNPGGFAIEEADGLYIDNLYVGAVTNGKSLLDTLNYMRERYRTGEVGADARIEFVKKVKVKRGLYPTASIRPLEDIKQLLEKEERGKRIYTVVSGDDPLKIAAKNGISFNELKILNPEVDVSLFPGDELLISQSVPYLGVKVVSTVKRTEEVNYKIEQKTDPSKDIGYTHTEQGGEMGLNEITEEIVMIDGIETERNIIKTDVIKKAIPQIMTVGGNRPLKIIPNSSGGTVAAGAFAWPTSIRRIGTGFRGYWGHTGSDLVWNGCHGSPIYASADGTVVAAGWGGAYGYRIMLNHGGGVQTLYAHCSQLYVGVGDQVKQGQMIAAIGRTGNVTGPHLHFEIRTNGTAVDPAPYLYGTK